MNRTEKMIEDAKMVATSTVEGIQQQREQIQNIDTNVSKVNDDLNRSDKLIKSFGKRMATDKLIQCFACFNIMLFVCIIVLVVIRRGLKSDQNDNHGGYERESPIDGRMLRGLLTT